MKLLWSIIFTEPAQKDFLKLDRPIQKKIMDYLENKILKSGRPYSFGCALAADKKGLWRYRVGSYRILCDIEDDQMIVLVVDVGHRRLVYG